MDATPARLLWIGDSAFTIEFGERIDSGLNARVLALDDAVRATALAGIVETVPTYRSLTIHVDPVCADPAEIARSAMAMVATTVPDRPAGRAWQIPVVYGGAFGIDLADVADRHGMTPDEVVERHAAGDYRVYMLGFLPGYAYLGGLDPSLALPRRETPRPVTPAGTISIGGAQALVASIAAPSGWHLLGRTPVRTFRPESDPVFLFEPGDRIRFVPIDAACWDDLDRAAAAGERIADLIEE